MHSSPVTSKYTEKKKKRGGVDNKELAIQPIVLNTVIK